MLHLIFGASKNVNRASYQAAKSMHEAGLDWVPMGIQNGNLFGKEILSLPRKPMLKNVHTITLYLSPDKQSQYYDYITQLNPKRVIFNPGSENPELIRLLRSEGIEPTLACTLVLLSINQYLD